MRRASYHPDLMRQPASDEYSMLDTLGITSIRQMLESLIDRTHDFDPFGKIHVLFFGVAWRYPNILHGCLQFHNACTHGCLLSRISNSHRVCGLVTLPHLILMRMQARAADVIIGTGCYPEPRLPPTSSLAPFIRLPWVREIFDFRVLR